MSEAFLVRVDGDEFELELLYNNTRNLPRDNFFFFFSVTILPVP
jgi:hypothetical protein